MGKATRAKGWGKRPGSRGWNCLPPLCMCVCDALSTEEDLLGVCSNICEFKTLCILFSYLIFEENAAFMVVQNSKSTK